MDNSKLQPPPVKKGRGRPSKMDRVAPPKAPDMPDSKLVDMKEKMQKVRDAKTGVSAKVPKVEKKIPKDQKQKDKTDDSLGMKIKEVEKLSIKNKKQLDSLTSKLDKVLSKLR